MAFFLHVVGSLDSFYAFSTSNFQCYCFSLVSLTCEVCLYITNWVMSHNQAIIMFAF